MGPFRVTQPNPTHGQLFSGVCRNAVPRLHSRRSRRDDILTTTPFVTDCSSFLRHSQSPAAGFVAYRPPNSSTFYVRILCQS